jgi:sigma-B regulation protein RsbU (phosphoserine phosphatase)
METLAMSAVPAPQPATARLLVADDQPHVLTALEMLLDSQGYETYSVSSPGRVLDALQTQTFDAVLMDLNYTRDTTGGAEGLELVSRVRAMDQTIPLVVMTAWSSVGLAVEAMRRGASDFVQKPWSNTDLLEKVREQVERCRVLRSSQQQQEEESSEASEIQKGLLPSSMPQIQGYEITATTRPMHFVGGDYYNVVRISETQTALCIADVAGKGLPGALLMANLQAALKPLIRDRVQPSELCSRLNRHLCDIMPANKFISLFYGVLDSGKNQLTYCNAGHNPPLLVGFNGGTTELTSSGAILGQFRNWNYEQTNVRLDRGDILLLFTDGVVEAQSPDGEAFGEQRLSQHAREVQAIDAAAVHQALLGKVAEHCGNEFQDDATMIVLRATR